MHIFKNRAKIFWDSDPSVCIFESIENIFGDSGRTAYIPKYREAIL